MKFKYRIVDATNRQRSGEVEGENLEKVADNFLSQGFTILELRPVGFNLSKLKNINIGGIPFSEKVIFMRQMSFMINAGLPLTQALEIAKDQINNNTFKEKIDLVLKDVSGGAPMSRAFERQGNTLDVVTRNLLKAGEESGKLDLIMNRVADDMEKKQEFQGKVTGALIYPIVIIFAIIGVVIALLVFMIPQMNKLYEGSSAELPFLTQIILNSSNFLTQGPGGVILLVLTILAAIGFVYYRRTQSGRLVTDRLVLKIPVFGTLIEKSQIASFARTFSMLITAGVPILDALKLVGDSTTNMLFRLEINEARKKVEKGLPLSAPLMNGEAFPMLMGHMVKVGEETGKIDEVVSKVGEQYAKEVDQMANNLSRLMEPIILIVMGIVVGGLALAVYLPVLNLGSAISG
jgi:type IV pilus assembly protein PilC